MQNSNSSILTNNSLISQPTLSFPFPPFLLPPLAPPTPQLPSIPLPLPPVIKKPLFPTPRIPIPFSPIEGPPTYILPDRQSRQTPKYRIKNELDDPYNPDNFYDSDIDEYTKKNLYDNPELARYAIRKNIRFAEEHMLVSSDEDNASTEEESDEVFVLLLLIMKSCFINQEIQ
jgi:hypothetical protein